MMIDKRIHLGRSWKVHKITDDFRLWDVWEFPINADNSKFENFQSFYKIVLESFQKLKGNMTLYR